MGASSGVRPLVWAWRAGRGGAGHRGSLGRGGGEGEVRVEGGDTALGRQLLRLTQGLPFDVPALSPHGPPHEVDGDEDEDEEGRTDGHNGVHPYIGLLGEVLDVPQTDGLRHRHGGGGGGGGGCCCFYVTFPGLERRNSTFWPARSGYFMGWVSSCTSSIAQGISTQ